MDEHNFHVPGNLCRNRAGKVTGYQCPFSRRTFVTEREQFDFSLALMIEQGPNLSFTQRRELWEQSQT